MSFENPGPVPIRALLKSAKTINAIWMQDGVVNEEAAARAAAGAMTVVIDRCIMRDFTRLCLE